MNRARLILYIILLIGLADTVYLTAEHYAAVPLWCPKVAGFVDCGSVLKSGYSNVFGIPLAIWGLTWVAIFLMLMHFKVKWIDIEIWCILGFGGLGYSVFAMYILGRVCLYCMLLDLVILLSCVVAIAFKKDVFGAGGAKTDPAHL